MIHLFIIFQILNSFAILVASTTKFKFSMYISSIIAGGASFVLYFATAQMIFQLLYANAREVESVVFYILLYCETILFSLFTCGSVAMLSPLYSNRMFPFRVLVTAIFFISFLVAYSGIFHSSRDACNAFVVISLTVMPFLILAVVCERDQWSNRIRRSLPKSFICRVILFPFYTGAACGIVWIFIMMAALFLIDNFFSSYNFFHISIYSDTIEMEFLFRIVIFSFNYCVTAMLIRSCFFKRFDSRFVIIIGLVLFLMFTLGSMLIYLFLEISAEDFSRARDPFVGYSESALSLFNPFCDIETVLAKWWRIRGMLFWFLVLLILLARWYASRFIYFNQNIEEPISYEDAKKIIPNNEIK
jgi:hypothetical protein